MASKGSVSSDGGEQEASPVPVVNPAEEEPLLQSDSETEDDEAIATLKAHRLGLGSKSVDEASDCSSPSASAFIIVPSSKPLPSDGKKKPSALKKYSDAEEITLLQGLAEFWVDGRNNKWTEFHRFIQSRLPREFTKIQISEKVRGLKRKYDNNVIKARVNGGRLDLSDDHELALFELSKKLWDDEVGIPFVIGNGKDGSYNLEKTPLQEPLPKIRKAASSESNEEKQAKKQKRTGEFGKEEFESKYPLLCESFAAFGSPKFVKDICHWMGSDKATEFEEKWRELKTLDLRIKMKKIELAKRDM